MKIESPSFTIAEVQKYGEELIDHEREVLATRLEAATQRFAAVAGRIPEAEAEGGEAWSAREVLAHIAVLSKFYGMLTYKIGSGQMTELDLTGNVNLRDVLGEQLAREAPKTVIAMALGDHQRTIRFLRGADAAAMKRECVIDGGRAVMRAEDVCREALVGHLELHLDQLEQALGG